MTYTTKSGSTFHAVELTPNFFQLIVAAEIIMNSCANGDKSPKGEFETVWEKKDGDNQLFLIQEKYN